MQIFTNNNDVNSEYHGWTKKIKLYHTNHGSYFGHFSTFHRLFWENIPGKVCDHCISALASLFVRKTITKVSNCLIWRVNAITMCLKPIITGTAKVLWSNSLGRTGSRLFVTIELICRANRNCIIEISLLVLAICHVRHFENGQVWPNFHC